MSTIREFPNVRATLGTLVSVGVTPQIENNLYRAFATFENNGRLEHYRIRNRADFLYLSYVLSDEEFLSNIFERRLVRKDLVMEPAVVGTSETRSILLFTLDGNRQIFPPDSLGLATIDPDVVVERVNTRTGNAVAIEPVRAGHLNEDEDPLPALPATLPRADIARRQQDEEDLDTGARGWRS